MSGSLIMIVIGPGTYKGVQHNVCTGIPTSHRHLEDLTSAFLLIGDIFAQSQVEYHIKIASFQRNPASNSKAIHTVVIALFQKVVKRIYLLYS